MAAVKSKTASKKSAASALLKGTTRARDLALIFQPKRGDEGAAIAGRLVSCEEKTLDPTKKPARVVTFAPAIILDGKTGEANAVRSASMVLSSSLALRIEPETDKGGVFAITFLGFEHSEKGNSDWRNYEVSEGTVEGLRQSLTQLDAVELAASLPAEA